MFNSAIMLRGYVLLGLFMFASTVKRESDNILAAGLFQQGLDMVTKSLTIFELSPSKLPNRIVLGDDLPMSTVWPELANEKNIKDCASKKRGCTLWLHSSDGQASVFYSTDEMNGTVRFDAKRNKLSEVLSFVPNSTVISSDLYDAMFMVERKYAGLMFSIVQYDPKLVDMLKVNETRLLCYYPEDNRVQFSEDIFHNDCGQKISWDPVLGFIADGTFYLIGGDDNVYIFDASVFQQTAAKLRIIKYTDFVTRSSGLSTGAIMAIVICILLVLMAICFFSLYALSDRKPAKQGSKLSGIGSNRKRSLSRKTKHCRTSSLGPMKKNSVGSLDKGSKLKTSMVRDSRLATVRSKRRSICVKQKASPKISPKYTNK